MTTGRREYDFSSRTVRIIAARAGYRCSFPGCSRSLVGPGKGVDGVSMLGEIGHIRSGAEDGPRYDPTFSTAELSAPQNGIFLCRHHHKVVDTYDRNYSVADLIQMKGRHEFLVASDMGGIRFPSTWIESLQIDEFRRFQPNLKMYFGRINHIFGNNGLGKSVVLQLLSSAITSIPNRRFEGFEINLSIVLSRMNQKKQTVKVRIKDDAIGYEVRQRPLLLFPEAFTPIHLGEECVQGPDDIESIRECYGFPIGLVERLVSTPGFKGVTTSNYSIRNVGENETFGRELLVDVGYGEVQNFGTCSGSEHARVILDIGIAAAVEMCRYRQVALLIDWVNISFLQDADLIPYISYLHSYKAHFQTFFISTDPLKKLSWTGWQEIKLEESSGMTVAKQLSRDQGTRVQR